MGDLLFAIAMASYQHFEELPVWQEAARLYNLVLDLLEEHGALFSPGFRNQIDRAGLSVSNNIAEGFDRVTTAELLTFLGYARGSASEVKSMCAVISTRRKVRPAADTLQAIRAAGESCLKQLTAWMTQIDSGPVQGKRHLTGTEKRRRDEIRIADEWRQRFLRSIKPDHPLYNSPEARKARGE